MKSARVRFVAKQFHPVVAVGNPIAPVLVAVPVPSGTVNAPVPLFAEILPPLVLKPDEIVGAVCDKNRCGPNAALKLAGCPL